MNHTRLESMFLKKHTPYIHAHKTRYTHAYHAHTHDLYANVYTCTHCGHKGHLIKFCYDRMRNSNFAKKFVWVRKCANSHAPKKVWIPRFTPIVFDVSVGALTRRESIGALMVDAIRTKRSYLWLHHFQRKFGGRTTMVWRHKD